MTPRPDGTQCEQPEVDPHNSDDWPNRLRRAVADTIAARQARRDQRAQLAEQRDHGLTQRHAQRLARAQGPTTESQVETVSPDTPTVDDHQAAALARLRRAAQGGYRPRQAEEN